ncbi:NAD(P)H-dependent FMN reductase [Jannaschia pagri]|uniref:NAD(P)H-dependent FMN reductase n=1 Tax=Jannaschia pagri TaxID=2829797 RepID=A0ABQ4NL66_9RHOB|nr:MULTISPECIES: NAD(P)H-dependent oxidoreductase [unclassified Jannaschia]GIT91117.1 NAD(P)H-dependent FMN reductase [Jannaschia sp. AI_61]GIT94949.1 NAD(P)H-dependent FMN reductase [Jannaschia sp. AI_62]
MTHVLGLCGSLRAGSLNRVLLREAARLYDAPLVEGDLRLPLYDGDVEEADGLPGGVTRLGEQIAAAPAIIIATPEYNKGPSGVLKNALDWVSRVKGGVWTDKPVAIVSATAGRSGGERAQTMLRACMAPFRADALAGPEVLVGAAAQQFDDEGRLTNEINAKALAALMEALKARATG